MASRLALLDAWHQTKLGLLCFTIVELALFYMFASFALDSGSLLDYLFTVLFLIGAARNFIYLLVGVVRTR